MENFSKKIENIIKEEYEKTNRKLIGINFLESFKFNLISKISTFKESEFFEENFEDKKNFIIKKNNNKIDINLIFINESVSQLKKEIHKDTLFIVAKGGLKLDIYNNSLKKTFKNLNIYPLMGICLSVNTTIDLKILKNSFYIEFLMTESNINVENTKKDII
tara:strand:+ start:987 stop:1472 length:486 start_codon:yes stop_codon:yes gene_type:complete